jgi:hypothetical protein
LDAILATLQPEFLELPESTLKLMLPKAYGERRNRESFNNRTGVTFDAVSIAEVSARHSLNVLLHSNRLNRLEQQAARTRGIPSVGDVIDGIFKNTVKASSNDGLAGQIQSRVAHLTVELLVEKFKSDSIAPEVKAVIFDKIVGLVPWLKKNRRYGMLKQQIIWFENTGKWKSRFKPLALPPGSPI